jgi:hypothetical protein
MRRPTNCGISVQTTVRPSLIQKQKRFCASNVSSSNSFSFTNFGKRMDTWGEKGATQWRSFRGRFSSNKTEETIDFRRHSKLINQQLQKGIKLDLLQSEKFSTLQEEEKQLETYHKKYQNSLLPLKVWTVVTGGVGFYIMAKHGYVSNPEFATIITTGMLNFLYGIRTAIFAETGNSLEKSIRQNFNELAQNMILIEQVKHEAKRLDMTLADKQK